MADANFEAAYTILKNRYAGDLSTLSAAKILDLVAELLRSGQHDKEILTASEFGLVSSTTLDQTTLLQAFFSETTTSRIKLLDVSTIKFTSPLTFPAGGQRVIGVGEAGGFSTILKPYNCRAFTITGSHHSTLENVMIWPDGTSPSDCVLYFANCYSHLFRDVRIHQDTQAKSPTSAVVILEHNGAGGAHVMFERVIIRMDGANTYPCIVWMKNSDCGSIFLNDCDFEVASAPSFGTGGGFRWNGGQVHINNIYSEALNPFVYANPDNADPRPCFIVNGGYVQGTASGSAVQIGAGTKNLHINGSYIDDIGSHFWIYDNTNCSNIIFDPANFNPAKIGSSVDFEPSIFDFRNKPFAHTEPTYSADITPTLELGTKECIATITVTNGTAFTVQVPSITTHDGMPAGMQQPGTRFTLRIKNSSGGAHGTITLAAGYKTVSAFPTVANGKNQSITFIYDAAGFAFSGGFDYQTRKQWVEISRTGGDISN